MSKFIFGLKVPIIIYALWRFAVSVLYLITNNLSMSSSFLSIAMIISMSLLILATVFESRILIEIWLIGFILHFGAIIFGVSNKISL